MFSRTPIPSSAARTKTVMLPDARPGVLIGLAGLALFASALLGCGGADAPEETEGKGLTQAQVVQMRQHIGDIEFQLEALEQQYEAMRGELEARIDQIDATRAVLATQVKKLKSDLGKEEAKSKAIAPGASVLPKPKPAAPAKKVVEKAEAPVAEAPAEGEDGGGAATGFFKFFLLIVFLGAIFFLSRYFFERWGVDEDGDSEPQTERVTELGKIRYPAAADEPARADKPAPTKQPDVFSGGSDVSDESGAGGDRDRDGDPGSGPN